MGLMDDRLFLSVMALGVFVLLASDVYLFGSEGRARADLESVRSGLSNSRAGLVAFPVADWSAVALFSLGSLLVGLGAGLALNRFFPEKRR